MREQIKEDINVQIIDMDVMIPEQVTRNADGSYTIFLNARLTHEHRLISYEHAIKHIKSGDFEKENGSVQEIELAAHYSENTLEQQPSAVYVPSTEFEKRREKALARIKRRRRKIEKQLKEYREDMEFIGADAPDIAFARAEHQWLYGKDL